MQVPNVEHVRSADGSLHAVIVYQWRPEPGVRFFTQPQDSLQVAVMLRAQGERIAAHVHQPPERTITHTAEVLIVQRGRLLIDFYGAELWDMSRRELKGGDLVVLFKGGHGLEFLEETELIECKQGPFLDDKVKLEGR